MKKGGNENFIAFKCSKCNYEANINVAKVAEQLLGYKPFKDYIRSVGYKLMP